MCQTRHHLQQQQEQRRKGRRTCPARRYSVAITGSGSFHRLYDGPLTILLYCSGLFS